jgi:hypothetical protein
VKTIRLPNALTTIGRFSFYGCDGLLYGARHWCSRLRLIIGALGFVLVVGARGFVLVVGVRGFVLVVGARGFVLAIDA